MISRDDAKNKLIELWKKKLNNRDIAEILNELEGSNYWDSERVRDRIRKYKRKVIKEQINKQMESLESKDKKTNIVVKKNKILFLCDLHIPFQRKDIFDIVEKHKNEIRAIVFVGDIMDMFEISKFPSIESHLIENELISAIAVLNKIKDIVGDSVELILCYGNHEYRWKKYIANMQQKKLYKFINPNVLEMLKDGFTLYDNGVKKHYEGIPSLKVVNSWYVNINEEIIVCHPNNFSPTEIKNAKNAIEHFISIGEKFKTVVVAHNHHQGEVPFYLGKSGVEAGCLCQEFDYTSGNTRSRPQGHGYYIAAFDNKGEFNINESKLYTLDTQFEGKKENFVNIKFV